MPSTPRFFIPVGFRLIALASIFFSLSIFASGSARGESNPLQQNWVEIPEPYAEMPLPVNPPTFRWAEGTKLPVTLVLSRGDGEEVFVVPNLERYFYRPLEPLESGEYVWALLGEGEEIVAGGEFSIDEEMTQWPVVASAEAVKNIPSEHPRVHIRPENLEEWKIRLEGDPNLKTLMRQHGGAFNTPMPEVPASDPNAPNAAKDQFWQSSAYALQMARGVVSCCVLYQITGDQRYLDFVKERALIIADLDPQGLTSHDVNDFGNSRIVNVLGWAYSWTYNDLTEEEREKIRTAIWERCQIALVAAEAEKWPWPYIHTLEYRKIEPHAWQFVNYHLMVGLIAIYGESEESDEWTEWLLDLFVAGYPWFGGEDGGSAEQVPYFLGTNLISSQQAVHLIKTATGIDLTGHPWHRNAPYFMVYGFGTGSNTSQFGDNGGRVPGTRGTMLARNAAVQFEDGILASYYDALREQASPFHSYLPVLEAPFVLPEREPLSILPTSRLFRDVGMLFMRSDIENPDDEIFFEFKSSPYGSTGHGHNDQNSFNLSAYGKRLLLDSGFYNYYQSDHHRGYTQTTQAHNAILFNHTGQPHGTSEYWGEIVEYVDTEEFTYAVGDAHRAYNKVDLERFDRHVLWLKPDLFIVADDIVSAEEVDSQFMLHAVNEIEVDGQDFLIRNDPANARVRILEPEGLIISQTDQFPTPLEEIVRRSGKTEPVPQWHLTAETPGKALEHRFVSSIEVFKTGEEKDYEISVEAIEGGLSIQVSDGRAGEILWRTEAD